MLFDPQIKVQVAFLLVTLALFKKILKTANLAGMCRSHKDPLHHLHCQAEELWQRRMPRVDLRSCRGANNAPPLCQQACATTQAAPPHLLPLGSLLERLPM